MTLSSAQSDRAAGVLLAMAAGDGLGAGYEFGPPLASDVPVVMEGGGSFGWAAGEWTDDTSMAIAIAEVSAEGQDLCSVAAQNAIAARWAEWGSNAKDVGIQTRNVLSAAARAALERSEPRPSAADLHAAATALHERTGRTAGNGSLMRTAPVALAYLGDPEGLAAAATALSALTHADPEAGEACALWCLAIRHAVLHGTFDGVRNALDHLPPERAAVWAGRLTEAETHEPAHFDHNGWVVQALQGAWSAITRTPVAEDDRSTTFAADHLRRALEAAVRGGRDTDTVAAIAGSLLGARWGASAVPLSWRRLLHGWPGLRARDLVRLGVLTARRGQPDGQGWPSGVRVDYDTWPERDVLARLPQDEHVWLSGVAPLAGMPADVTAVVSLCRLGVDDVPVPAVGSTDHVEVWLVDRPEAKYNPHLDYVLNEAANMVAELRAEGKTVLLHCVQAHSRTPAVAALYASRLTGRSVADCLQEIQRVLPSAGPNASLRAALDRLS
ncbi:MAG TPA: ADP-ribosylglycohydrolase family protein [Propionibacteriaceae bacterium]